MLFPLFFLRKLLVPYNLMRAQGPPPPIVCKNMNETCMGFSRYAIHVLNVIKLK